MTHQARTIETRIRGGYAPRSVSGAARAMLVARGNVRRVKAVFDRSLVPMVITDAWRRYVDINRPARLWFRLGSEEMRRYALDDLAPPDQLEKIKREWARLLDTGSVAGHFQSAKPDGGRIDVVYRGVANVLPGLHLSLFAPADWPEDEFGPIGNDRPDQSASLTPREIEVLALAAEGLGGPELARALVLSPATINTHFKNIYEKLQVRSRAAAVAKAMRLGVID